MRVEAYSAVAHFVPGRCSGQKRSLSIMDGLDVGMTVSATSVVVSPFSVWKEITSVFPARLLASNKSEKPYPYR